MKKIFAFFLVGVGVLLSGCRPDEGVWWSPDGQVAAVRSPGGLRLSTAEGALSALVLEGDVQSADWLRDSSAIAVCRTFTAPDWSAAEALIPKADAAAVRDISRALPDLLKAGLIASDGSIDDIEKKFLNPLGLEVVGDQLETVFRSALVMQREKMMAALAGFPNAKELEKTLLAETNSIVIYEISLLSIQNGKVIGEPKPVVRSLRPLLDPVVSPGHPILAYRTSDGALKATTLDGNTNLVVIDKNARSAVWSSDGRSLIHVVMAETDKIGEIRRRTVVNGDGALLTNMDPPQVETLAVATFDLTGARPRLQTLADGRILFASVPVTLPAKVESVSTQGRFFLLDLSKTGAPLVPVEISAGSLPSDLNAFAASPDGRRIAVVEAGTDVVAVVELATGKVEIISPPHSGWKSKMVPAWRNNRELTIAALPEGNAMRPELLIWEAGVAPRVISKNWPDDIVKEWLAAP